MKTSHLTKENVKRDWHLVDAADQVLGRLSTKIATLLIGKHKVTYSPHLDCGDYVVVVNATKILVTGKKEKDKMYRSYSGFPGGLKELTFREVKAAHPDRIISESVKNMLPKNKLRRLRLTRLRVFPDTKHPFGDKFVK